MASLMPIGHRTIYRSVASAVNLPQDGDLLEIGCGAGLFMKRYGSNVRKISGLDHSEDMVKLANYHNRKRILAGAAEVRCGDPSELPWEDGSFSAVVAIENFFWWKDPSPSPARDLPSLPTSGASGDQSGVEPG